MSGLSTRRGARPLSMTLLLLALPAAVLLVLLNIAPLVFAGWESVHLGDMIASGPFAGLRNYARVLGNGNFWSAAAFTLVFTVVGVFGSWAVGLALALFLRTRIPWSGLWRALLVLPWIIPIPTSARFWSSLVAAPQTALHFHAAGLAALDVFASPADARILVCLFRLWVSFPFMMLMMSSALTSVDPNVYEAAQVDGAGPWRTFTRITLPLISRTTYVSWILMAIFCVNDYPSIANLTDGGPVNATQTLIVLAWQTANEQGFSFGTGIGQATAIAFLMAIVLVATSVVLYRLTRTTGEGTVSAASMGANPAGVRARGGARPWFRLVAIVLVTAVLLYPIGTLLYSDVLGGGTLHGLASSIRSAFDPRTLSMFWRSAMLACVTVVVCVVIGAPAGYAIARARGRTIAGFSVLVFAVQSFPVLLLLWPMLMLSFRLHLVFPGLGPLPVVQVIYIGMSLGFAVWMFSAFLKTMPIEIEEAAWADGCSVLGAFFRVVLPNAIPAVISTGIFVFLLTWGDWQIAGYIITPAISPNAIPTLGVGGITSLAFLLPPLVIFFVFNRYFSLGGVAAAFSRK